MRRSRVLRAANRAVALAGIAALTLVACSSSSTGSSGSRGARLSVGSNTPLDALLLGDADLASIPAAHTAAVHDLALYQDPDPRTPCGHPTHEPDFSNGAGIGVQSDSVTGVELLNRLGGDAANAYVDLFTSDAHVGCAAYDTTTNTGSSQTVTLTAGLALDGIGERALAIVESITNKGHTVIATQILVARGGVLAVLVLFGAEPLTAEAARSMAQHIDAKLAGG